MRSSRDQAGSATFTTGCYAHLEDFVVCYKPENRHVREQTWSEETPDGRWRAYSREELLLRDKASLDVFWLKDAS